MYNDFIKVFECPKCQGRILRQVAYIPAYREIVHFGEGSEKGSMDDILPLDNACLSEEDVDTAINENYSDCPSDDDYVYCTNCGKSWSSMYEGQESLEASGAIKTIPEAVYAKWLETEFEQKATYTWRVYKQTTRNAYVLTVFKDDKPIGRIPSSNYEELGEWWFLLKHVYPNPEILLWDELNVYNNEDWEDYEAANYPPDKLVVIIDNGEYNEEHSTPQSDEIRWQYDKLCALKLNNKPSDPDRWAVLSVPSWAICYLVNGDASGLTEEELKLAKRFNKTWHVTSVSNSSELIQCPWTHKLTDCKEVICVKKITNRNQ